MQAQNREIKVWYAKIANRELVLPRFQRSEAWSHTQICGLMNAIVNDLPCGIALILNVGEAEPFISRPMATAPKEGEKVTEQLLDGQQRLTSIWRSLHDNYSHRSFFVYSPGISEGKPDTCGEFVSYPRWDRADGKMSPLWCDKPRECLQRDLVPSWLFAPGDPGSAITDWLEKAFADWDKTSIETVNRYHEAKGAVEKWILARRETIAHYNLPFLALPSSTDREVALDVFVNMNRNGEPLTQFDIIVAQLEASLGMSLVDKIDEIKYKYPKVARYGNLSDIIFNTASLLQGNPPNQSGAWKSNQTVMVQQWDSIAGGMNDMATLLEHEGVFDSQRLPTTAILWVVSAIYASTPDTGDKRGVVEDLMRRYIWRAFLTDRYDRSAATRAQHDYKALSDYLGKVFVGDSADVHSIPIFDEVEFPIADASRMEVAAWPKKRTILGRAMLAIATKQGACDFATGAPISAENVGARQYHHVFPDAMLQEAGVEGSYRAINCALIEGSTNLDIGRKEPLKYLAERYLWVDDEVVDARLGSHFIPVNELRTGGYEGLSDDERARKVEADYRKYVTKRAELIAKAALRLV